MTGTAKTEVWLILLSEYCAYLFKFCIIVISMIIYMMICHKIIVLGEGIFENVPGASYRSAYKSAKYT